MDRRLFLSSLSAMTFAQGKGPIPIGFLGAVHSHGEAKIRVVQESPDWRLVGVVESDSEVRRRLAGSGIALLDREQLLGDPQVRVIAVESAVADHARDALAALEAGKHLHLEKAPAATQRDFKAIVELARKKKLLVQIGYMWRYHPGLEKMLEAARSGWLGHIYLLRAVINNQLAAERRPEWAAFAGGTMFELGGHVIDPLVRLMGRPRKITPFLRKDGRFADSLKDNTVAVLEWEGAIGVVSSANLQPASGRYRSIEFHGTNGSAILQPIEPPKLELYLDKAAGPYSKGVQQVSLRPYRRYVDDFVELAAAVRGDAALRVSYEEDLAVQETLLEASGMAQAGA